MVAWVALTPVLGPFLGGLAAPVAVLVLPALFGGGSKKRIKKWNED